MSNEGPKDPKHVAREKMREAMRDGDLATAAKHAEMILGNDVLFQNKDAIVRSSELAELQRMHSGTAVSDEGDVVPTDDLSS